MVVLFLTVLLLGEARAFRAGWRDPRAAVAALRASATDTADAQWELYTSAHAGVWHGAWTTHDNLGDVLDADQRVITEQLHDVARDAVACENKFVVGGVTSACETCADNLETRAVPLGERTRGNLRGGAGGGPGHVLAGRVALCNGPRVLRSGVMATELALVDERGDGRLRVTFQHAPVWSRQAEDEDDAALAARQTGPPDALALFRVVVARERRVGDGGGDVLETRFPTKAGDAAAAAAAAAGGAAEASAFWAGVPPFVWATEFAGERWECAEGADVPDAEPEPVAAPLSVGLRWHERVADEGIWSLRLPGNRAIVQCARAVKPGEPAPLRVAWLPRHDDAGVEMLRAEAVVVALAGVASDDDDALVRIAPPRLIDLRGDAFRRDEDAHAAAQAAREGAASPEGFDDLLGSL